MAARHARIQEARMIRYLLVPVVTLTALAHTFAPVVKTAIAGFGVL